MQQPLHRKDYSVIMSHNSGDIKLPLNDSQSDRLSLMETDEDFLATSQELPPPKLDYCVECKDQEVICTASLTASRLRPFHLELHMATV